MCVSLNSRSLSYNGSRLAAGDLPAGARVVDDRPGPPGAQHSASVKTIIARQLRALVTQRNWAASHVTAYSSATVPDLAYTLCLVSFNCARSAGSGSSRTP